MPKAARSKPEQGSGGPLVFTSAPINAKVMIAPQSGRQTEVLLRPEDEVLFGGARGGGKTFAGYFFLMKGNPDRPQNGATPHDLSYVLHPHYRALILRRNYNDLSDWLAGALKFFGQLPEGQRPKYFKSDRQFEWPSGAVFIVSHLDDAESYLKYRGHQYQRLLLEEASLIPDEAIYAEVLTSIRSTVEGLRPQAMLNTNPDGPGLPWVKARFIVDPVTGKKRSPGVPFTVEVKVDGRVEKISRIFIPSLLSDNPALLRTDPRYRARLESLPSEAKRRAYIYGDWDALAGGIYFEEFRREPQVGEPAEAFHCVRSSTVQFEPWFREWWSMDWGFDHPAVFYRFRRHEDEERLYVVQELRFRRVPTREMGRQWASTAFSGLEQRPTGAVLTLWVSHDMYRKYVPGAPSGESDLEVLMAGIEEVLGAGTVQILADSDSLEDLRLRQETKVVLRKAPSQRVPGWGLVVDLLSWRALERKPAEYDHQYAMELLARDSLGYVKYRELIQAQAPKGVPKLRIFEDKCPRLVQWLERAVRDEGGEDVRKTDANSETGEGGDDEGDALRYGVAGWARSAGTAPKEVLLRRKIEELEKQRGSRFNVGELVRVNEKLEQVDMVQEGALWVPQSSRAWALYGKIGEGDQDR